MKRIVYKIELLSKKITIFSNKLGLQKLIFVIKRIFSVSPRFIFHTLLIGMVIFVSFSNAFASKRQNRSVIAEKVLSDNFNKQVDQTFALKNNSGGIKISANNQVLQNESSLAITSENCLAKPTYAQTIISEKQREGIIDYVVVEGDTLWSIANKFDISTDTIKWANNIEDENLIKPGQKLIILPVSGVLHTVGAGETLEGIAGTYQASVEMIIKQNKLKDRNLKEGQQLIIPGGKKPEPPKPPEPEPEPSPAPVATVPTRSRPVYYGGGGGNFPYGYCTWYVASRRSVPPGAGNAWTWFGAAQAAGWATGYTPAPGAIMVTWESGWGHVALVEAVYGNTFTVSEMNYVGWGVVSSRTITTSSVPLIGFIY